MANDSNGSRTTEISICTQACATAETGGGSPSPDAAPKRAGPTTNAAHGLPPSGLRP